MSEKTYLLSLRHLLTPQIGRATSRAMTLRDQALASRRHADALDREASHEEAQAEAIRNLLAEIPEKPADATRDQTRERG